MNQRVLTPAVPTWHALRIPGRRHIPYVAAVQGSVPGSLHVSCRIGDLRRLPDCPMRRDFIEEMRQSCGETRLGVFVSSWLYLFPNELSTRVKVPVRRVHPCYDIAEAGSLFRRDIDSFMRSLCWPQDIVQESGTQLAIELTKGAGWAADAEARKARRGAV